MIGGSARVPLPRRTERERERPRDIRYLIYMASISKSNPLEEADDAEEEVCQLLPPKTLCSSSSIRFCIHGSAIFLQVQHFDDFTLASSWERYSFIFTI